MDNKHSLEELLLEFMPFSVEIIEWCKKHPDFQKALKIIYSNKFISWGAIVTSYSPNRPNDEVIGIYTYDYKRNKPLFKQDFIVNIEKANKEFVLYTRNPAGSSKYVKDINDFYKIYGNGGYYLNSHHLQLNQLPKELQERGNRAIQLAHKIQVGGYIQPSQEQINKTYMEVTEEKKKIWRLKKKLT